MFRNKRIEELEAVTEHLQKRLDNLRDSVQEPSDELRSFIRKCVWESMQSWLNSGHRSIVTLLNGKRVETKYIRNQINELTEKKRDLELVLERVNEELEKCGEELDAARD